MAGGGYTDNPPRPRTSRIDIGDLERQPAADHRLHASRDSGRHLVGGGIDGTNRRTPCRPVGELSEQLPHGGGGGVDVDRGADVFHGNRTAPRCRLVAITDGP